MEIGGGLFQGWWKLVFKLQADCVCYRTEVITHLFQPVPGTASWTPSQQLGHRFPINSVLRAFWEFPESPAAEYFTCQQIPQPELMETARRGAEPNPGKNERLK